MTKHITVVGIIVEFEDKILFLHRHPEKPEGNTWGLPAGKQESQELPIETAKRELFEETGIQVNQNELEYKGTWLWKFPEIRISFPTYIYRAESEPEIILAPNEHYAYAWMTQEEYLAIDNAVHGTKNLIRLIYYDADPESLDEEILVE